MNTKNLKSALGAAGLLILSACTQDSGIGKSSLAYAESPNAQPGPAGLSSNLASINGTSITESELNTNLTGAEKGRYLRAKTDFFDAQREALDAFIMKKLTEEKAKKANMSAADYKKKEVDSKISKVSDADIKKFYENIKKERPGMNLPELDKIKDKISEKLTQDKYQEKEKSFFASLRKEYNVIYETTMPRLDVAVGTLPVHGPADAPITLVAFSDFECPFCSKGKEVIDQVNKNYKGKVKVYFRDFPLSFHSKAKIASNAAHCAAEQGKFWEFHDQLFNTQKDWTQKAGDELTKLWSSYAAGLKLNTANFDACVKDNKHMAAIDANQVAGEGLGVTGTPAFFINGIMLSGAVPFEKFKDIIDQELQKTSNKKS